MREKIEARIAALEADEQRCVEGEQRALQAMGQFQAQRIAVAGALAEFRALLEEGDGTQLQGGVCEVSEQREGEEGPGGEEPSAS